MIDNEGHDVKTCPCGECASDREAEEIRAEIESGLYWYYGPEGTSARWWEIK